MRKISVRLNPVFFKLLTVLRLNYQLRKSPVHNFQIHYIRALVFEDLQRETDLTLLDHERALFAEVRTKQLSQLALWNSQSCTYNCHNRHKSGKFAVARHELWIPQIPFKWRHCKSLDSSWPCECCSHIFGWNFVTLTYQTSSDSNSLSLTFTVRFLETVLSITTTLILRHFLSRPPSLM